MPRKATYGSAASTSQRKPPQAGSKRQDPQWIATLERLAVAIEEGRLKERAPLEGAGPEERAALSAVNRILDAMATPLGEASDCALKLSQGILPPKVAEARAGGWSDLTSGLNGCVEQWSRLAAQVRRMSEEHHHGDIDVAIVPEGLDGVYRELADQVNAMVSGHVAVKKKAMACVDEFSQGQLRCAAGAVSGEEGLHQRDHRAAAGEREAVSSKR